MGVILIRSLLLMVIAHQFSKYGFSASKYGSYFQEVDANLKEISRYGLCHLSA